MAGRDYISDLLTPILGALAQPTRLCLRVLDQLVEDKNHRMIAGMELLVIEDDVTLANFIAFEMRERNHDVHLAATLAEAHTIMGAQSIAAVVLDRMLPDGDGMEFLREIRAHGHSLPVLVLSALGDVNHRIEGLRNGGDDYLVKPFDIAELDARLEALVRRSSTTTSTQLHIGELSLDLIERRVWRAGSEIRLQPREFKLLEFLAQNHDQIVTRTMLLESVWGLKFDPQTNVVDVHISRLRHKLQEGFEKSLLHTVRGEGYKLASDE